MALLGLWSGSAVAGAVRISQVYGGGGVNTGPSSPYNADYVELFNAGGSPVDIGGWVIAYDTFIVGNFDSPLFDCGGCVVTLPAQTVIAPCHRLLVQIGPVSTLPVSALPTPDVILPGPDILTGIPVGTIALMNSGTPNQVCPTGAAVEDLVGWGLGCRCKLGTPATAFGPAGALIRLGDGLTDTGNNAADFAVTGTFTPHNAASGLNAVCGTPALPVSWGAIKTLYR